MRAAGLFGQPATRLCKYKQGQRRVKFTVGFRKTVRSED
jgi:hypothetical protein